MGSEYHALKRKVILDLLEKYPDTSTRALARIVIRDHSVFFKDYEEARVHLRIYKGQSGEKLRKAVKMRKYYKT